MSKYKGIARYAHVITPGAPKGTDNKQHSINILIHKSDPQCAIINAEHESAKANGFPGGFPANGNVCWTDLAITDPGAPALRDYMCLKASTKPEYGTPVIVDAGLQPIMDPAWDSNVSGKIVYIDCSAIQAYNKGSEGVKAYLNGVMDTGEVGAIPVESLSSKPTAETMFGNATQQAAGPGPNAAPTYAMTAKAAGNTREQLIANGQGWSDELLISQGMMVAAAPATPSPAPNAAPTPQAPSPAPNAAPVYQMTDKAAGHTRDQLLANGQGWSDELLISQGMMLPPGGVTPSFA